MSDRFPTLQDAINVAVERGLRSLSVMLPAKVVKYDATKQKANCQILIKQVTEGEDGEREAESWPVVPDVPVQFMGAGDFRITFPVDNGTTGMLIFCGRSMDKWLAGDGSEVDPEFDHDHGLQDAVFVPGLRTFGAPLSPAPASDVIELSAGGTTQLVAVAQKIEDTLTEMITSAIAAVVPNDGGASAFGQLATDVVGMANRIGASKVKVE